MSLSKSLKDHLKHLQLWRATIPGSASLFLFAMPILAQSQSAVTLDSQEVYLGQRSILYNRIAPPELKSPTVSPDTSSEPSATPPTAEELAESKRWDALRHVTLNFSCTAIEGTGLTEVRWRVEKRSRWPGALLISTIWLHCWTLVWIPPPTV